MSWSIYVVATVPAAKKYVEAHKQDFTISEEAAAYMQAKNAILSTLNCIDEGKIVKISASGHAMTGSTYSKASAQLKMDVEDLGLLLV